MAEEEIKRLRYEQTERQKDRKFNAQFSLWNAIITLNGFLVGAISILFLLNNKIGKFNTALIFILALVPITLLIIDYFLSRNLYLALEKITEEYIKQRSDTEYENDKKKGGEKFRKQRKFVEVSERIATFLTIINIIFIIILILK